MKEESGGGNEWLTVGSFLITWKSVEVYAVFGSLWRKGK
jgi:hypothetical protein